jgi:hypothetical protein
MKRVRLKSFSTAAFEPSVTRVNGESVFDTFPWPPPRGRCAVLAAYGFSAKKDLLAQLLALNLEVAAKIEKGSPVTAPGVPKIFPDPKKLVKEDRIRPAGV